MSEKKWCPIGLMYCSDWFRSDIDNCEYCKPTNTPVFKAICPKHKFVSERTRALSDAVAAVEKLSWKHGCRKWQVIAAIEALEVKP